MRLLILDCKNFEYNLNHRTPVGEDISEDQKRKSYEDTLIIFIAIEEKDEKVILERAARDIINIVTKNKSKLVILNPFAHLSANLAKPDKAMLLLKELFSRLKQEKSFRVERSVFGWYKEFSMSVNGHANSQIYREY